MNLKLLLLGGLVLLFFFLAMSEKWSKRIFYITVVMFVVRKLEIQPIGDITPAAYITVLLFLLVVSKDFGILRKWWVYISFLAVSLVIGWLGPQPDRAFAWEFPLLVTMMIAVIAEFMLKTEEDLTVFARCIIAICAVFSIATIMGYLGLADGTVIMAPNVSADDMYNSRVCGITSSNLINIACVASITLLPTAKLKYSWMEWLVIGITMYAALITVKRMTFIAMLLALIYYVTHQIQNGHKNAAIAIAILVVVLIPVFWKNFAYRFAIAGIGGENDLTDGSSLSRIYRASLAIDAFLQSPIIGKGAGFVIYIHNGLFEILGNCGLLGVFSILLRLFPRLKDVVKLNPWAAAIFIFSAIGLMLEATLNITQLMAFGGMFLGGYFVSRKLNIDYSTDTQKCEETDLQS